MRIALTVLLSMSLLYPGGLPSHESSPQQNQKAKPSDQPPVPAPTPAAVKEPLAFGLEEGTPVKLRLNRTISSADAHVNDTVDFEVLEEVKVHDVVVVPRGSIAWGTVTEVEPKRRMGRGGKLNVNIDDVKLASGEKVPLRAVKEGKGGGHVGAMTGAMVATAIVFFPAAPLFLFMKGKDITTRRELKLPLTSTEVFPWTRRNSRPSAGSEHPVSPQQPGLRKRLRPTLHFLLLRSNRRQTPPRSRWTINIGEVRPQPCALPPVITR
jgi:hypothetical protein